MYIFVDYGYFYVVTIIVIVYFMFVFSQNESIHYLSFFPLLLSENKFKENYSQITL